MPEMIEFHGQQVAAERVEVAAIHAEPWAEYRLVDGTILRNKAVLMVVWRLCEMRQTDGQPIYLYQTHNVASIVVAPPAIGQEEHNWLCERCGQLVHASKECVPSR